MGFSGLHSLHYRGEAAGLQQLRLFKVDLPVRADTQLSYLIFPQRVEGDLRNPANYVAVDLLFDDGSRLSMDGALDQHRIGASAQAQGIATAAGVTLGQINAMSSSTSNVVGNPYAAAPSCAITVTFGVTRH